MNCSIVSTSSTVWVAQWEAENTYTTLKPVLTTPTSLCRVHRVCAHHGSVDCKLDTPLLAGDTPLLAHHLHQNKSYKHTVLDGTRNPALGEVKEGG